MSPDRLARLAGAASEFQLPAGEGKLCPVVAIHASSAPGDPSSVWRFLSPARQKKILRLQNDSGRVLSAAAELSLIIGLWLMNTPSFLPPSYACLPGGKPVLNDSPFFFSLSHGGSLSAAALCPVPVGLDVEGPVSPSPALILRCMPKEEARACLTSAAPAEAFRRGWVARESYVKLTGEGLSCPFSQLHVDSRSRFESIRGLPLRRFSLPGHELAVCSQSPVSFCLFLLSWQRAAQFIEEISQAANSTPQI